MLKFFINESYINNHKEIKNQNNENKLNYKKLGNINFEETLIDYIKKIK